jgi:hypothetical protein
MTPPREALRGAVDGSQVVNEWGPLWALAGEWEGEVGIDVAYSHAHRRVVRTPYREKASFTPFGPVENGHQRLFGLDYSTAMWRESETRPFHTEVGYWLWDATAGEVVRAFVVPRGISVLAGGTAVGDADEFSLAAELGAAGYTIGENRYLARRASSLSYRATITVHRDGTWTYDQVTMLGMGELAAPLEHTDRNTMHRVA